LAKRKRQVLKKRPVTPSAVAVSGPSADPAASASEDPQVQYSGLSLHELFAQQARTMLERSDLDEEQKQSILIAMSCPCCGAGGPSFTMKLKRKSPR
jgi:hypothetical protein